MSEAKVQDLKKEEEVADDSPKNEVDSGKSVDDLKDSDNYKSDGNAMPSSHQEVIVCLLFSGMNLVRKNVAFERISS